MPTKKDVAQQFGRNAANYSKSKTHSQGSDLTIILQLLKPQSHWKVLDVATGAGHTAALIAPVVSHVVASDLTAEMIAETKKLFEARGIANATAEVMDAEALSYPDESFDAVTCRIAPHHFTNVPKALREIARVLPSGGTFVLEDSVAPQSRRLDQWINDLERLRDPTHVRSYTKSEWRAMLTDAGFAVHKAVNYRKRHNIAEWMKIAGLGDDKEALVLREFLLAPMWAREHYELEFDQVTPLAYTDDKAVFKAVKR